MLGVFKALTCGSLVARAAFEPVASGWPAPMARATSRVAAELSVTSPKVDKRRARFLEAGAGGLLDEPRPVTPPRVKCSSTPWKKSHWEATRWSTRPATWPSRPDLAVIGVAGLRAFGLTPHLEDIWKPRMIRSRPEARNIVGAYLACSPAWRYASVAVSDGLTGGGAATASSSLSGFPRSRHDDRQFRRCAQPAGSPARSPYRRRRAW